MASNRINAGTSYLSFLFPLYFPGKPEKSENKNAPPRRSIDSGLAERAGFEPAVPLPVRQFSKLFLSASQASLRTGRKGKWRKPFSKVIFNRIKIILIQAVNRGSGKHALPAETAFAADSGGISASS